MCGLPLVATRYQLHIEHYLRFVKTFTQETRTSVAKKISLKHPELGVLSLHREARSGASDIIEHLDYVREEAMLEVGRYTLLNVIEKALYSA